VLIYKKNILTTAELHLSLILRIFSAFWWSLFYCTLNGCTKMVYWKSTVFWCALYTISFASMVPRFSYAILQLMCAYNVAILHSVCWLWHSC